VNFLNEVAQHCLSNLEISDDAVFQRPDRDDAARRPSEHAFRFRAYRQNLFASTLISLLDGNNRWFIANDALILHVDQCVGGSKIDRKIVGKHPEEGIEHHHSLFSAKEKTKAA
jgi:hypothetical protein